MDIYCYCYIQCCPYATCRKMSLHPRYRAKVRSRYGFDEMALGGNPLYTDGDDRERHIYPAIPR